MKVFVPNCSRGHTPSKCAVLKSCATQRAGQWLRMRIVRSLILPACAARTHLHHVASLLGPRLGNGAGHDVGHHSTRRYHGEHDLAELADRRSRVQVCLSLHTARTGTNEGLRRLDKGSFFRQELGLHQRSRGKTTATARIKAQTALSWPPGGLEEVEQRSGHGEGAEQAPTSARTARTATSRATATATNGS